MREGVRKRTGNSAAPIEYASMRKDAVLSEDASLSEDVTLVDDPAPCLNC